EHLRRRCRSLGYDDEGDHILVTVRSRPADDAAGGHLAELEQRPPDLESRDFLALPSEAVRDTADEMKAAVLVDEPEIAGMEPAASPGVCGCGGGAGGEGGARSGPRRPGADLAPLAHGGRQPVLALDPHEGAR